MRPEAIRIGRGFAVGAASVAALLAATPALAQTYSANMVVGAMPLAVALGAGAFALLAGIVVRRLVREARASRQRSEQQAARLRTLVDGYEALISGMPEVIVLWTDSTEAPKLLGQPAVLLPPGRRSEAILDFPSWLGDAESRALLDALEQLQRDGHGFHLSLLARDGRVVRATGWALGGGLALRIRPAFSQAPVEAPPAASPGEPAALSTARTVLAGLAKPAFLRNAEGRLVYGNPAYHDLAASLGKAGTEAKPAELIDANGPRGGKPHSTVVMLGRAGEFELVEYPVDGGSAGYLHPRAQANAVAVTAVRDAGLSHLSGIIDALTTPIAIFNARRELVQFNSAYAALWRLDPAWLRPGMDERQILDKLRTDGALPAEPDYHGWRARHLKSYELQKPEERVWHLPDGRTVQVIAAPAGPQGGVIYVFEDITQQLVLQSQHRSLLDVQRSTINALSEAVAVFGTNGRLTLANPRLSVLWKVPVNLLDDSPHIDQIAAVVAGEFPEDGAAIWADLKRKIIDLNPTRADQQGRIGRADGKLIDYAVTRLPDGQRMITFLDVSESANYQRVLTERNEALVTADRLKDAFVQNVSYEFRSPLTNIIGFAELLASETAGPLNERQKSYTEYIRASSETLGLLIDSILDLQTVDAGIAELRPEPQDVRTLVNRATAGLAATFPKVDGEAAFNLVVDVADNLPVLVADGTRIVQVLYNLLSSSARYSEPGGEVRLTVRARGEHMTFVVEDEGAPLTGEARAALLDRDSASNGRDRGAGLALAIVRAFVNMHGGTVQVEKRQPRGTRVTVTLPRDAAMLGAAE